MSQTSNKKCPICNGSRKMEIVRFVGIEKKFIKLPCTACDGKGKILFVNRSITEEPKSKSNIESLNEISDGWRRHNKWDKAHYINNSRPLCRIVRSTNKILESKAVDNPDTSTMCSICSRKLLDSSS
jgi:hypothetical protein